MQSSMKHCNMMVIYLLPTRETDLTVHKMKANNKKSRSLIVSLIANYVFGKSSHRSFRTEILA